MRYLAIDCETTGLDPEDHDILEFGAVLDDLAVQAPLEELPRFHAYVLPPREEGYVGQPVALAMNADILRHIGHKLDAETHDYVHPGELANRFAAWCRQHGLSTRQKPIRPGVEVTVAPSRTDIKFTVAGKNVAGFDLPFLRRNIPGWSDFRISHRVLDPGMLYFDPRCDKVPPNLQDCIGRAGLRNLTVDHTAVGDSLLVVQVLRAKYPVESFEATCMCDGGGAILHARSITCTSGGPR